MVVIVDGSAMPMLRTWKKTSSSMLGGTSKPAVVTS
jgi:hypothetical protein